MTILLLVDHDNASLSRPTAKMLTVATKIRGDIHILVAEKGANSAGARAVKLAGVSKELSAESAAFVKKSRRAAGCPDRVAIQLLRHHHLGCYFGWQETCCHGSKRLSMLSNSQKSPTSSLR